MAGSGAASSQIVAEPRPVAVRGGVTHVSTELTLTVHGHPAGVWMVNRNGPPSAGASSKSVTCDGQPRNPATVGKFSRSARASSAKSALPVGCPSTKTAGFE